MITSGNVELLKWGENMLKEMTPPPINSMLTKQPVTEAVAKRKQRAEMTIVDVPPTAGNYIHFKWKFYFFEQVYPNCNNPQHVLML